MRTPLQDTLVKGALVTTGEAGKTPAPGDTLARLFAEAQRGENQYAAERLSELHELAERALTLGAEAQRREARPAAPPVASWPVRAASIAAGGLLAFAAPLVAEASLLLAGLSGLAALGAIALPFGRGKPPPLPALPGPERAEARIEAVASAADKALQAMVEPRSLPAPSRTKGGPDEDVLGLLQDALALSPAPDDEPAAALAENAQRLAAQLGYRPVFDGDDALFEIMVDPSVSAPLTLRPALVHDDPARTVAGVRVRGAA